MDKAPCGKYKQMMYKGRTFTYFQVKFFFPKAIPIAKCMRNAVFCAFIICNQERSKRREDY